MLGELPPIEYGSDAALLAELRDCVGAESDWNSEASVGAVATEGAAAAALTALNLPAARGPDGLVITGLLGAV